MTPTLETLSPAHLDEWITGSGVAGRIAQLNIESLEESEINERGNWKALRVTGGGWWCRGVDWRSGKRKPKRYGQVKPDTPPVGADGKPIKYLTASRARPDAIFLATQNPQYWLSTWGDPKIPRLWTEGAKKAGALLSCGYSAIALTGVWNWGKRKRNGDSYDVAPITAQWIQPDTTHYLAFDSDYTHKKGPRMALKAFGAILEASGCKVFVMSWGESYKGIDDLIVAEGKDAADEAIATAEPFQEWVARIEKQFAAKSTPPPDAKPPKPAEVAARLAEDHGSRLVWDCNSSQWFGYEIDRPGTWGTLSDTEIELQIQCALDADDRTAGQYSFDFVRSVAGLLRGRLLTRRWESSPGLIPFANGVLRLSTGKLEEHAPGHRQTWALPRPFDPAQVDTPYTDHWFQEVTGGDASLERILWCWLGALLRSRYDLQKFLHLVGTPGSGKGSFIRLCVELIGRENIHTTKLEIFCGNQFESANAYQKKLITFPDEDVYRGGVASFKQLIGEDWVRAERKRRDAFQFQYEGLVMVASNYPVFCSDLSGAINRRTIMVPFNHVPSLSNRRDLIAELRPELVAITNRALAIPDQDLTSVLLGTTRSAASEDAEWAYRMQVDTLADWVNERLISDPDGWVAIGSKRDQVDTLYGDYCLHCADTGSKPKALKTFSPDLERFLRHELHWDIDRLCKGASRTRVMRGIRLRTEFDSAPFPLESFSARDQEKINFPPLNPVSPDHLITSRSAVVSPDHPTGSRSEFADHPPDPDPIRSDHDPQGDQVTPIATPGSDQVIRSDHLNQEEPSQIELIEAPARRIVIDPSWGDPPPPPH